MSKRRVVVSVLGGVVQGVFADQDIEVVVVDWDAEGADGESLHWAVDSAGSAMQAICYQAPAESLDSMKGTDCGLMVTAMEHSVTEFGS